MSNNRAFAPTSDAGSGERTRSHRVLKSGSSRQREGLPAIIESMLLDHRYMQRLLELLDELTQKIERSSHRRSSSQLSLFKAILRYMTEVCDPRHHAFEDRLIDILQQRSLTPEAELLEFSAAHKSLKRDVKALQRCVERAESKDGQAFSALRHATLKYVDTLRQHIALEESVLFPLARKVIRKSEWRKLALPAQPDPLFGKSTGEPYLALFTYLTRRIVRVGIEGYGLGLMRGATSAAERLDVLASGMEDMGTMLAQQVRKQWQDHIKSLVRIRLAPDFGKALQLVGESTRSSLRGARAIVSETASIASITGSSLLVPGRDVCVLLPPDELSANTLMRQEKPSWQAQALNLPLRLWLKQKVKNGEVKQLRALGRGAQCFASALSIGQKGKPVQRRVRFGKVRAEWIAPLVGASRVLLYLPGGAFILPPTPMHRSMIEKICRQIDARALLVNYRLAPENPFPAGLDDCVAAYRHLLRQGIDPRIIVIAGDSAGGGLVLSTLLALRDAGDPLPASAIAISPLADLTYSGASRVYNRSRDPMLPTNRSVHLNDIYLNGHAADNPLVSPIYGDFTGCPPLLIQVGSTEMLLDDSLSVAERARTQGVAVDVEVWHQMPHVWHLWKIIPEAGKAINHIAAFVQRNVPEIEQAKAA